MMMMWWCNTRERERKMVKKKQYRLIKQIKLLAVGSSYAISSHTHLPFLFLLFLLISTALPSLGHRSRLLLSCLCCSSFLYHQPSLPLAVPLLPFKVLALSPCVQLFGMWSNTTHHIAFYDVNSTSTNDYSTNVVMRCRFLLLFWCSQWRLY
jgi:hypothetical protein